MFPGKVPVVIMAKDQALTLAVGGEPHRGKASQQAGSVASRAMLDGKWNAVLWGRWADPLTAEGSMQSLLGPTMAQIPDEAKVVTELGRVAVAHLFESGIALRLDDRGAHLLAEFTTMAADPPDVYKAYSDAVSKGIASGKPYAEQLAATAAKHPETLAAKQAEMLKSSAPTLAFAIGIGAAIAVPAFVKYAEKSKAAALPEGK
jgi:hypothetical protein